MRADIQPRWGRTRLADIRHEDVQDWLADMTRAPATIRKTHRVWSQILDYAVRSGRLTANPARGVTLPTVEPPEKRYLTHAQVEALATEAGPAWRLLVLLLAYTGLRWGEVAALKVSRLDLLRRRIVVAESVTPVDGVMTWGTPKGRKTQEVAAERKALETRQAEIAQQAEAVQSLAADYGKVHALDAQIKAFEAVDWDALDREALASEDPISAQAEVNKLERQYRRLQAEHAAAKKELDGKVEEHRLQREREAATAMQETSRTLADPKTGIKGWGPEKAAQLAALAAEEGVSVEELKHADARTWKLLNHLHEARAQLAKQTKASAHEKAQKVAPVKTVSTGGGAFKPGLSDDLPTKVWLERRNADLARKRGG